MIYKVLSFILLISLVSAFQTKKGSQIIGVVKTYSLPDKPSKNKDQLVFSQLITKYLLIPLETNSSCLIKNIGKIEEYDGNFYILNSANNGEILVFSKQGRFINSVKKKGQGPGEYVKLIDFSIDNNGWIYLLCRTGKVILLDHSLKYVREFKMTGCQEVFEASRLTAGSDFIAMAGLGAPDHVLVTTDLNGRVINFLASDVWNGGHFENMLSRYSGNIRFNNRFCDTVFTVNPKGLIPEMVFDFGKRSLSRIEFMKSLSSPMDAQGRKIDHDYFQIMDFEESQSLIFNFLWGQVSGDPTLYFQIVRKADEVQYFGPSMGANDLLGMFFTIPVSNVLNGEYMAIHYQATALIDKYNTLKTEIGAKEMAKKYPVLDSICRLIDYDSNPVIFLFK